MTWNQINNPYFIYKNDQRKKIDTFNDFENKKPTHMNASYAISRSERNFPNRFPGELDEDFDTLRISWMNWISSNFMQSKKRLHKFPASDPPTRTTLKLPGTNLLNQLKIKLNLFVSIQCWNSRIRGSNVSD